MVGDIPLDKSGKPQVPSSGYNPPLEVKELTRKIKRDYTIGYEIQHRSFREFNDRSVLQVMDDDQKAFNSYVSPQSQDPDEAWRFVGVRPITRNKLISIAAHTTAVLLYPNVFAQNDADEEDRLAAETMRDLMEYNIRNSEYEMSFLFGIVSALVNPCVYLQAQFHEVMQQIKVKDAKGHISKKEVLDEIYSGFHANVVPVDEVLIANPYEFSHQKQRFEIQRRFIDYDEAEALYGTHKNFKHVKPGTKVLYSDDGSFYEVQDENLSTLVEEVTYSNRREDLQVCFMNGVFVSDENIDSNRITHRDANDKPKYNKAKSGYEPIDEGRFYYFKSAASKFGPEQRQVDRMYQLWMDGAFLSTMPPLGVFGNEQINSSVMIPGKVTNFSTETKMESILPSLNLAAGAQALEKMESSITESSQDNLQSGAQAAGSPTAFEVAQREQNARIQLGLFGKMIANLVKDFGELTIDIIVNHQTVAEAMELAGGKTELRLPTFLLQDQSDKGKNVTKKIKFTEDMGEYDDDMQRSYDIMEEEGGYDSDQRLIKVNPEPFRKLKFKVFIEADNLLPRNEALEKALKLEAYDRMIMDPFSNKEEVARDFLYEVFAKGESGKYMTKMQQMIGTPQGMPEQEPPEQAGAPGVGQAATGSLIGQLTGSNSNAALLRR